MKKTIFLSLSVTLLLTATVNGMESSNTVSYNDTMLDELHIPIVQYLLKGRPIDEALVNLKNYRSTCKKNSLILKDKKIAHSLIDYMRRYMKGFTLATLDHLFFVLDTEKVTIYKNTMSAAKKNHDIFKKGALKSDWNDALRTLQNLKIDPLSYHVVNFCWIEDPTMDQTVFNAKNMLTQDEDLIRERNLLTEALSLDAPHAIISLLIELKADTNLIRSGPSALCIAVKKFLYCKKDSCTKDLQEKIDSLIDADANLDYYYFALGTSDENKIKIAISPLTMAVNARNIKMVQFLITHGVKNLVPDALLSAALNSANNDSPTDIIKALLKISSDIDAPSKSFKVPVLHTLISLSNPFNSEKMISVLDILLEKSDLEYRPMSGSAALELALTQGKEDLANFLRLKGACISHKTFVKVSKERELLGIITNRGHVKDEDIEKQLLTKFKNLYATICADAKFDSKIVFAAIELLDSEIVAFIFEQRGVVDIPQSIEKFPYGSLPSWLFVLVALYEQMPRFLNYRHFYIHSVKAVVALLLDNKFQKNVVNNEGKTASEKARECGFEDLAACIDSYSL